MKALACCIAAAGLAFPAALHAAPPPTGFTDYGQDLDTPGATMFSVDGSFRVRGEVLDNFDLDRGLTPSGQPLFPVPLSDPTSQFLTNADMRLRTDLTFRASAAVAVKVRLDILDDAGFGSDENGPPETTTAEGSPAAADPASRRAYGEALTPFGLLVLGRTGSAWGLGIMANGGDCEDCDGGDSADRVALITPLLDHIFAIAYDISASGPFAPRPDGERTIDLEPAHDVRSLTFAILHWHGDAARARRTRAGKTTVDYGAYLAHRWQANDVPAWYLPTAEPGGTSLVSMSRGFRATAFDVWFRISHPQFRIEGEGALSLASVDQPSLVPGVLLPHPVRSEQAGGAIESDFGALDDGLSAGIDLGVASGDPAPGFGAFPSLTAGAPKPGDLDGPQASAPNDYNVDNFRFNPNYHIDRILFREIVGTVTDAIWAAKPHASWRIARLRCRGRRTISLAAIASRAIFASSTPGDKTPLGVEIDPTIAYRSKDGFGIALEHAVLFPLAGLDNPTDGLTAKPAQLIRARVMYRF